MDISALDKVVYRHSFVDLTAMVGINLIFPANNYILNYFVYILHPLALITKVMDVREYYDWGQIELDTIIGHFVHPVGGERMG